MTNFFRLVTKIFNILPKVSLFYFHIFYDIFYTNIFYTLHTRCIAKVRYRKCLLFIPTIYEATTHPTCVRVDSWIKIRDITERTCVMTLNWIHSNFSRWKATYFENLVSEKRLISKIWLGEKWLKFLKWLYFTRLNFSRLNFSQLNLSAD